MELNYAKKMKIKNPTMGKRMSCMMLGSLERTDSLYLLRQIWKMP